MEFSQPPSDYTPQLMPSPRPHHQHHQHSNNLVVTGGGGGGGGGSSGGSSSGHHYHHHHHHNNHNNSGSGKPGHPYFKPFINFGRGPGGIPMSQDDFDGKRLRKSVMRKTVDYNASIVRSLENRIWQRDHRDRHALQPESIYIPHLLPPHSYIDNPSNAVTTKFVKTATNKMRCPIFTLAWTPEGRRLVTGASSGEFTLWNGLTFNFETILQAHDVPVRTMVWSHNDSWMVTGDHGGYVKYWQSNMNNVKMFQAHKEPIRGISFSPTDSKFVSCSDDGTLRVWDFFRCQEERVLRGHGADVKCVHWHPQKSLIVSGSKDNQQPIKLWDPKSGQALATLHAHKSTVMDLKWNDNGNWLVTASRDHLLKLFDLRNLREEVQIFRGHKKEASSVSWHPIHEGLFSSGGSDGSILFWNVGTDKEIGGIDQAHDSIVWTLAWHPVGHILCSGSNDHTIKFWTRNRPGDQMRDKYNLNTLPASLAGLEECDIEQHVIPGMGPEDKVEFTESLTADKGFIPGLDLDTKNLEDKNKEKKVPYSKPIPRNFQAQWNDTGRTEDVEDTSKEIKEVITHIVENTPGVVPLKKIAPSAIIVYGKVIPVHPGSDLEAAILNGPESLNKYISSGAIEELVDVMPFEDNSPSPINKDSSPDNKSPNSSTPRKSRFDDARDHNAQMIYSNDTDLRQLLPQSQQQTSQPQTSVTNSNSSMLSPTKAQSQNQSQPQKPAIPNLLDLKVPAPEEFLDLKRDQDFRRFSNFNDDQRPSPWATPLPNSINNMPPPLVPPQNLPSLFDATINNFVEGVFNGDVNRDSREIRSSSRVSSGNSESSLRNSDNNRYDDFANRRNRDSINSRNRSRPQATTRRRRL